MIHINLYDQIQTKNHLVEQLIFNVSLKPLQSIALERDNEIDQATNHHLS
jgi:hypothetical protein